MKKLLFIALLITSTFVQAQSDGENDAGMIVDKDDPENFDRRFFVYLGADPGVYNSGKSNLIAVNLMRVAPQQNSFINFEFAGISQADDGFIPLSRIKLSHTYLLLKNTETKRIKLPDGTTTTQTTTYTNAQGKEVDRKTEVFENRSKAYSKRLSSLGVETGIQRNSSQYRATVGSTASYNNFSYYSAVVGVKLLRLRNISYHMDPNVQISNRSEEQKYRRFTTVGIYVQQYLYGTSQDKTIGKTGFQFLWEFYEKLNHKIPYSYGIDIRKTIDPFGKYYLGLKVGIVL